MNTIDPVNRLIVHHSASSPETTVEDIRRWHVEENGWDEIGYHWVISSIGMTYPTRPTNYMGAHARGANHNSLGVCLIGDNTADGQGWAPVQIGALQRLWQACRVLLPDIDICGHRDVSNGTECPGLDVRALMLGPNA